jgi:hypothetical protein
MNTERIISVIGLLGYEPSHTIDTGLDAALTWYMRNL